MKTAALLLAATAFVAAHALAQSAPPRTPALPPPGLHDPGVKASAPAAAASSARSLDLKPQALPAMRDEGAQAPRDQAPPEVRIRREGDNTIQEYSRNGRVYMVVVTPKNGIQQTYMVDPQGRLVDEHGMRPVGPVMYKVLEWGKSRPPAEPAEPGSSAGDQH